MTPLFLFLLSSLVATTCCGLPPGDHQSRIVNGTDAADGEFPFVVQYVYLLGSPECGASVINEYWVMTAAHCVYLSDVENMYIRPGTNDGRDDEAPMIHASERVVHENFSMVSLENDIALLKLEQPLSFGPKIQPALLPEPFEQTAAGTEATVVGWGMTEAYPYTNALQKADIVVWSDEDCQQAYSDYDYQPLPSNICAGLPEGGRGQCNGDSGSPLIANGYQIGIVSWSRKPCASKGSPGVFTEVSYYVDWIKEKTSNSSMADKISSS
ncbi:trypsin-1-like [Schistocerca nitens]|uniref:trypsin-1-like n=1 Tax=Schistocerca nitens TaxID=7011 RepID=UPI002117F7CA|nr:trypsin-1-like [Schistocerca nitens]